MSINELLSIIRAVHRSVDCAYYTVFSFIYIAYLIDILNYFSLMNAVSAITVVDTIISVVYGWEKVIVGEFHFVEEAAWIVFSRRTALFVGNTEVVRGNGYLYVS